MTNSNTLMAKMMASLFLLVFAVVFPVGGIAFGMLPMYKQLSGWWQANSYEPVAAKVLNVELKSGYSKKTKTYQTKARFGYEYQGQLYLSNNIGLSDGGSDNISSYQQDIYQQLSHARNDSSPVTLWVNPRQPDQAVYDRSIRWLMILFLIPFAVLFPAVGLGAGWAIWRIWRDKQDQGSFSIASDNIQTPPTAHRALTIQGDGGGLTGISIFSAFWNLLSWPIAILFFARADGVPWWALLLVSIFPAFGLGLLAIAWKTWRHQWRLGKPVLVLSEPGMPGSIPLQGRIQFSPPLGLRLDASEVTHAVSVGVEHIRENQRGDDNSITTLWHGQALQTQLARGTESLNFRIDLPENPPATAATTPSFDREYWQVVLETLGGKVNFRLPVGAVNAARSKVFHETPSNSPGHADTGVIRVASRIHWTVQALVLLGFGYFLWDAVSQFAVPMYRSWQNPAPVSSQATTATLQADRSQLPKIHAPFVLDSFPGNGFGVVAKVIGTMEIGDNTLVLHPKSIELRSQGSCAPDCPYIDTVNFMLTQDGEKSFSTRGEGELMPVLQSLPDVRTLTVRIAPSQPPIAFNFPDREKLADLRLTLAIAGLLKGQDGLTAASWYTHAEPFPAILGREPVKLELATDSVRREDQAHKAVFSGKTADLEQLLDAGVDANARDADGETLLMRAANRGDLNSVNALLAHGADANATTPVKPDGLGGMTALHAALRQDADAVVAALIKAGANPQAVANQVWTPMHYGAYRGAAKSIRYLHGQKVSVDTPFNGARGSTPLMLAAQAEQTSTIRVLLELGADPKRKDIYGEDACGYAKFFKKPASVAALGCG